MGSERFFTQIAGRLGDANRQYEFESPTGHPASSSAPSTPIRADHQTLGGACVGTHARRRSHHNQSDLRFSDRPHARPGEVFERRVIVVRIPCRVLGISMWNDYHHPLSSSS
jgi:hypothetical protein